MTTLLFPGRHLVTTAFQEQYLRRVLHVPLDQLPLIGQSAASDPIDQIIFAITSSNQAHSRYNPIPFHVRAIGVDRFARPLEMTFAIRYRIIGIPHYRPTPRFAHNVLKEIEAQTEGEIVLNPDNCVVLCSTPAVIKMYQAQGFAILPAELKSDAETPIELIKHMVDVGETWFSDGRLRHRLSAATFDLWQDFPHVPRRIVRLWRDPLLNDAGSLTADRDYTTYAQGMNNHFILSLKYDDIKDGIQPGKIVDEGCADGALLSLIARDFPDSDLIGIEITGEFLARARERQRAGTFGGAFVYFHQRNIMQPVFEPNTINTTICNSTVHELYSYGDGEQSVAAYFALKFAQTAPGGRLIIRDVVGPHHKEKMVWLWLNRADGLEEKIGAEFETADDLEPYLQTLSTYGRFLRFARDFHHPFEYDIVTENEHTYAVCSLQAAAEFMSKKDYLDSWDSEMHEAFAFWSFADWKRAVAAAGFRILENPNEPEALSRVYTNPWIVKNRWEGSVALFTKNKTGELIPHPWPPTNIVLVAEKKNIK
ncbi:MAG: methyltransferase domain-containing protein [Ardenticatenaceae bacterium]|nr:methyltransferase domain-containing protein [Ardenticatenaceae bacterium]